MAIDTENNLAETEMVSAAVRFVNSTASHIFLTGKAGTGKTTFLKNLAAKTHKQMVVVAPTGIAALNAGGVTIHSQFLFPFGIFLPDDHGNSEYGAQRSFFNPAILAKNHPLNTIRKQVLRSIDLLVIDEVSMLRADLLDAIDYRLRSARGNFRQEFGGVQLLMIGDLYQLPPVVRREDAIIIERYYKSSWFFDAKALQKEGFVYIELDKIFRQSDPVFIGLLNNLRNNQVSAENIATLNAHYKTQEQIKELPEVIILTTHNYKADELNQKALNELSGKMHYIDAVINGEFPETIYPVLSRIELKEGAQIMFTKNDNDKAYFNGKLARVVSVSGGEVKVQMTGTNERYTLKKEVWENKKYTIDSTSREVEGEVVGTFEQYPIKLAWAITVHKSQGLTFDRAIIDVGQAFADGQVYVALSRLRSLDGLILSAHIKPGVVSTDKQVVAFSEEKNRPGELPRIIKERQQHFIYHIVYRTFDLSQLISEAGHIRKNESQAEGFKESSMEPVLDQIRTKLQEETNNTEKFRNQLITLLESNDHQQFLDRMRKGSDYYKELLTKMVRTLLQHMASLSEAKGVKSYLTNLTDLDHLFAKKQEEVDKALYLVEGILAGRDNFDFSGLTNERRLSRAKLIDEVREEAGTLPKAKKPKRPGKKRKKKKQ